MRTERWRLGFVTGGLKAKDSDLYTADVDDHSDDMGRRLTKGGREISRGPAGTWAKKNSYPAPKLRM